MSATVIFTGEDISDSRNFMRQVDKVEEICKNIPVYDFYNGQEWENEKRFVKDIPRQILRIAYDTVKKEIGSNPKKVVSKTSFRGNLYEIIVIMK